MSWSTVPSISVFALRGSKEPVNIGKLAVISEFGKAGAGSDHGIVSVHHIPVRQSTAVMIEHFPDCKTGIWHVGLKPRHIFRKGGDAAKRYIWIGISDFGRDGFLK